jgi:hypothetical protein
MTTKEREVEPIRVNMFDDGQDYVVSVKPYNQTGWEITMGDYDDAHLLMELLQRSRKVELAIPA